jgi:uncharacterized protein involved in exopolysaccharide biosynthesis
MQENKLIVYKGSQSALAPRRFFTVVFRRRKLIILSFIGVFLGVVLAIILLPDQYQAEMKVLVERMRFDPVVTAGTKDQADPQPQLSVLSAEDVNTEVDMLQSEDLLENVVTTCHLEEGLTWWRKMLPKPLQHIFWPDRKTRIGYAVQTLLNNLTVNPPNQSNLIKITYTNSDAKVSAQVLDTLGKLYMQKHLVVHRPTGSYTFFQKEVDQYQKQLKDLQGGLVDFGKKENVVAAEQEKKNTLDQLSTFDATLQTTLAAISDTEHRIAELQELAKQTAPRRMTQVKTSAVLLEQLRSTLFNLNLKRTELLTKYEPSYRLVQDVDKEIAETRAAIALNEKGPNVEQTTDADPTYDWLTSELAKSRSELVGLRARADETQRVVAAYRERARHLNEKGIVQQDLQRATALAEENYFSAVRKQEEARMSDELDRTRIVNASIAENANVPLIPVISLVMKLVLGFILASMVSLGLGFVSDHYDQSFRTPDELEEYLGVPVLAVVAKSQALPIATTIGEAG